MAVTIIAEINKNGFKPFCNLFGHQLKQVGDEYTFSSPEIEKTYKCLKCKFCNYKAVELDSNSENVSELSNSFDHWLVYNKPYRNAKNGY